MRTSIFANAALAACAFATPVKRDEVVEVDTVIDMVTATALVTVTAGEAAAVATEVTSVISEATSSAEPVVQNIIQHLHQWGSEASSTIAAIISPSAAASSSSIVTSTEADVTSSAAASSAALPEATTYQQRVVQHHNFHRANHSAAAVTWDAGLANTAALIASSCHYAHNISANGGGYGQNIAAGVAKNNVTAVITNLFYNGEVNYFNGLYGQAQPSMDNFESWGHFSQVVWKGTTKVGCHTQDCSASGLSNTGSNVAPYFTVCNYSPPGNYENEYGDNVGASLKRASIGWSYNVGGPIVSGSK